MIYFNSSVKLEDLILAHNENEARIDLVDQKVSDLKELSLRHLDASRHIKGMAVANSQNLRMLTGIVDENNKAMIYRTSKLSSLFLEMSQRIRALENLQ